MTQIAEPTELELATAIPAEVAVGDAVLLTVVVRTPSGGDLRGAIVEVVHEQSDEALATASLAAHVDARNESEPIAVPAPSTLGRHEWLIRFPEQELDGLRYGESSRLVNVRTRPQRTSLAVWAVPTPVLAGSRFRIKAGTKSAGGHDLRGAGIEVRDEAGAVLASGSLSDEVWPGTAGLHWAELELTAPETEGVVTWSVAFAATDTLLPHEGSSARFSFATVRPASVRLSIRVFDAVSGAGIAGAKVRAGVHQGTTDETGLALLEVPDGSYAVAAWQKGYEAVRQQLALTDDRDVQIGLAPLPDDTETWL